jgi:hypothetical protein
MYIHIYVYMYVIICIYIYTHTHIYKCTHTHTYTHTHTHTHTLIFICTYKIYLHICTYITCICTIYLTMPLRKISIMTEAFHNFFANMTQQQLWRCAFCPGDTFNNDILFNRKQSTVNKSLDGSMYPG